MTRIDYNSPLKSFHAGFIASINATFLLRRQSRVHIFGHFGIDQPGDVVLLRETFDEFLLMLLNTAA